MYICTYKAISSLSIQCLCDHNTPSLSTNVLGSNSGKEWPLTSKWRSAGHWTGCQDKSAWSSTLMDNEYKYTRYWQQQVLTLLLGTRYHGQDFIVLPAAVMSKGKKTGQVHPSTIRGCANSCMLCKAVLTSSRLSFQPVPLKSAPGVSWATGSRI